LISISGPTSDAFAQALGDMIPRLRRFGLSLCRDAAEADDLTSQTLERAWRARDQWSEGTRLDAWLFQIQRNIWIDTRRAHARAGKVLSEAPAGEDVGHDPRPGIEARLELAKVRAALERLPADQREAVSLVLIEGLSYADAAKITGAPMGTFSSRLTRGRAALLALLGEASE
jgi:RNA polymerase sigma-70 factor (ECF subfamily)